MNALEALQTRNAAAILPEPAPTATQLNEIFKAALRAPDHGELRPWRFLTIQGDARQKLSDVLHNIKKLEGAAERDLIKAKKMALRAPMIIVVIASLQESEKIPVIEQEWSAAAATQNILVAAEALGLGAIWRTGWPAFHSSVNRALGLMENEKIVAYVYIGQQPDVRKPLSALSVDDYCSAWS